MHRYKFTSAKVIQVGLMLALQQRRGKSQDVAKALIPSHEMSAQEAFGVME